MADLLESQLRQALKAYAIEPGMVAPIRDVNNSVYKVITESQETFALRIHRKGYRTPEQTVSELCYLKQLSAVMDVPVPIRTRDGDLVVNINHGRHTRHASLLTWVKGGVRRPHGKGAGPRTIYRIGHELGRIHAFSSIFEPPSGFTLPSWDSEGICGERSPFRPGPLDESFSKKQLEVLEKVRDRLEFTMKQIGRTAQTFGIIHKDLILLNCLHHGNRTSVIDFDDCGWGYYLYDLGGMLENLKDYQSYTSLRSALLRGYRSVRALPSAWERYFDLMIAARHATTAIWMAGKWRVGDVDRGTFEGYAKFRLLEAEENL